MEGYQEMFSGGRVLDGGDMGWEWASLCYYEYVEGVRGGKQDCCSC